uniref:Variant surface glycoprotein 1644 n=1 Tax=Trypanosoma brucei TaxID=5691 RepID=M4SWW4_9TRYP|nr:variant surface glycoprotein 1644 [Trypanosoma brucei]
MWFIFLILALWKPDTANAAGENVNGLEFNVLCHIVNLANAEKIEDVKTNDLEAQATKAWEEIDNIFTVTANDTYYAEGSTATQNGTPEESNAKKARVEAWVKKRQDVENQNKEGSTTAKRYVRKSRSAMRLDTQHKLDKLFITASKLQGQIASTQSQIYAKEQEIKKALRTALIGGTRAGTGAKPAADTQAFGNAYTTSCAGNAGPGKSLANDLVCLCGATTSTGARTLKMCTSATAAGGYTQDIGSAANALTVYGKPQPICAKTAATEDATPEAITEAIAAFTGALGRHTGLTTATNKGAYVFGKGEDNAAECTGGAGSQQSCVNYHGVITKAQEKR